MPSYVYKAMTKYGVVVKNKVEADSKQSLIKRIKRSEMIPISVEKDLFTTKNKKAKKNISAMDEYMKNFTTTNIDKSKVMSNSEKVKKYLTTNQKITPRDIVVFTQDLYVLKKANFNNVHALRTIIDSTDNLMFKGVLEDILAGIEAGDYMYTTMEYYSNIYPYIYTNMIKVGELSGSLTNSLEQAVKYLDDTNRIKKRLRNILIPNIIQFVLIIVMLVIGTLVAIPAIQGVYAELGTKDTLPPITLWFQKVMNVAIAYWYIPVILIIGVIVGIMMYIRTPRGRYNFDYFKYKAPVFGQLIFALDFSRLMKAMHLNLQNGMRIQDSLDVSKNVVKNYVLRGIIETSINNILIGSSWIEPFESSGLCKPMVTEMLKIGMETDLAEMIEKLNEYLQIDIDDMLDKIMKTLPQIVYAIVGVVLIFFVIVVLVPCVQVYMGNFLFSAYLD